MADKVIKRDGSIVDFDEEKIKRAILGAMRDVGEVTQHETDVAEMIAHAVRVAFRNKEEVGIEEIQDLVETNLMKHELFDVAKAYIRYRYDREKARNKDKQIMAKVEEKLNCSNVENQNANVDEKSFGGRSGEVTREILKQHALDHCMSEMARKNHLNNEIYIHDLDSYSLGMHNCAARETKFLTDKGVYSFEDFKDGDKIVVLTHTGQFKKATVKSYGCQVLNKITFARAGQRESVQRFTSNHRWILSNGNITDDLKVGDKILKAPMIREFNFDEATDKEKYYWCLGFVLADGTEAYRWSHGVKNEDVKFVRMRLCGDKVQYEPRFKNLAHSTKEMDNGDLYLTFSSIIGFRKLFPDLNKMTFKEKIALFEGIYSGDGEKHGNRKSILTSNEQIASFIEDVAPSLGYYILNIKDKTGETTNYSTRGFAKEFTFIGDRNKYYWTVVDIERDQKEDVWCLEVEDDHSFVLPNGIVTGNCLSLPIDDLLKNGFKTRQTDVRPANSINTAMQLVAVLFQIQSLQQFGK